MFAFLWEFCSRTCPLLSVKCPYKEDDGGGEVGIKCHSSFPPSSPTHIIHPSFTHHPSSQPSSPTSSSPTLIIPNPHYPHPSSSPTLIIPNSHHPQPSFKHHLLTPHPLFSLSHHQRPFPTLSSLPPHLLAYHRPLIPKLPHCRPLSPAPHPRPLVPTPCLPLGIITPHPRPLIPAPHNPITWSPSHPPSTHPHLFIQISS